MMQNTTERISNRDFAGYGGTPPNPQWPDGARVAVSLVVNFEEGAEYSVSDGDAFNEATYEVVDRVDGPDSCIDSHFEYGTRAAWWRIMRLFDEHKVKVTVSSCGRAVERLPEFARERLCPRIQVGLEHDDGPALETGVALLGHRPHSRQRGAHLGRMVGVIVENPYAVGGADQLEAPPHALETGKSVEHAVWLRADVDRRQ